MRLRKALAARAYSPPVRALTGRERGKASAARRDAAWTARCRTGHVCIDNNGPLALPSAKITDREECPYAFFAESCRHRRAARSARFSFRPGNQGRHRHLRMDGLCPADAGQGGRHLQEERARRLHQEDPAEGPPPRDRLGRHPVRRHHGRDLDRLERQRRGHQADLPARQVLRRRRHGRAQRRHVDQGAEGQDGARFRARHGALFHARLVPEEERAVGEGRDRRQPGARRGRAGLRFRPGRCGHDLRALSLHRPRRARQGQDHRHHARLSHDHGYRSAARRSSSPRTPRPPRRWPTAISRRST